MTLDELKQVTAAVGPRQGWDFSRVREEREPVPWHYDEVVPDYLKATDRVLDIGTGGGEVLLSFARHFASGSGVDFDPEMVAVARKNAAGKGITNVSFEVMEDHDLRVPDEACDVVLNRHSSVHPDEIVRVLRPGGYFISQQVGDRNTANIHAAFGWSWQSYVELRDDWDQTFDDVVTGFRGLRCHICTVAEYDVAYRFLDVESFIFWLLAVPWPEEINLERHYAGINRVMETCMTERCIETNEHRKLLIVQK